MVSVWVRDCERELTIEKGCHWRVGDWESDWRSQITQFKASAIVERAVTHKNRMNLEVRLWGKVD